MTDLGTHRQVSVNENTEIAHASDRRHEIRANSLREGKGEKGRGKDRKKLKKGKGKKGKRRENEKERDGEEGKGRRGKREDIRVKGEGYLLMLRGDGRP